MFLPLKFCSQREVIILNQQAQDHVLNSLTGIYSAFNYYYNIKINDHGMRSTSRVMISALPDSRNHNIWAL